MLWEEYYEKLGDWATSTAVSRLSQLASFGPPDEIIDAINTIGFDDEKGATRLLKKATAAGVKFTGEQLAELCLICDEEALKRAIQFSSDEFTADDLEALYCNCDDDILIEIARKWRIKLPEALSGCEDFVEENTLNPYKKAVQRTYSYCPNCGRAADSNFCPNCGCDLRNRTSHSSSHTTAPRKISQKSIYLGDTKITQEQFEEIRQKITTGEKLQAIKRIRRWTTLSLANALHIADNFYSIDFAHPQVLVHDGDNSFNSDDNAKNGAQENAQHMVKTIGKGVGLAAFFTGYGIFHIISELVKPFLGKRK